MSGRHFRFYISSALVFLALLVSLTVGTVLLWSLKTELEEEIADRLVNTARLGVKTLDVEAYERLVRQLSPNLTPDQLAVIEASDDFHRISDELNELRGIKSDLFLYVYTLYPTSNSHVARFVVDADVLSLRAELAKTGKTNSTITPFNMEYKLDDQPTTVKALQTQKPVVEPTFVYDYTENVYSMMGLAPIFSKSGEFLGVLGIDASNQKVNAYVARLFLVAVVLTALLVALILLVALRMAHVLSRPILELTESVRRISGKDWKVRVDVASKIREIYDLKTTFNEMADRIETYQNSLLLTNRSLLRFVPIEFLKFLDRKDITEVTLGDQTKRDMAVLFLDVHGFSSLSEGMSPKQLFNFLNSYLGRIAPIIRQHGGFIDKYEGDGIMALFPGDCDDAVHAAVSVQRELARFNQERERDRLAALEVGIGIHAGVMMLGAIGEEGRIQGAVISDAVNVAILLEERTRDYGSGILVSKDFYNRLKHPEVFHCRFIGWVNLRGKVEPYSLLEIFEAESDDQRAKKARSKPEFERGISLLHEKQTLAARAVFEAILRDNPLDRTALRFAEECRKG